MFTAGLAGSILVYQQRGMSDVFWAASQENRGGLQLWALYIFYLSKFYELLDTVILVLKKVNYDNSYARNQLFFCMSIITP